MNDNKKNNNIDIDKEFISVYAQYIKDLSFENLISNNFGLLKEKPQIELSLDLNITHLKNDNLKDDNFFEVELSVHARAKKIEEILFLITLKYAGIFNLINIQKDQQNFMLAVNCPYMIFPYVRKIIADTTQDGGFYPLMIDPIDFGLLYNKKISEEKIS